MFFKEVIQLYDVKFRIFSPLSTNHLRFQDYLATHSDFYAWDGVCGSREACMCNKGLNEAFGEKLFNFMLFNLGYLVICHPTPLRSHAFVAMQSIMLEMGSVGQGKLLYAIRV